MGAHRKSIIREVIERFDTKMAIGASRRAAKQALRRAGQRVWTHSTGKIHAFKTRSDYQEHTVRFVKWARTEHHIISLAQLDPRAEELASTYLAQRLAEGKSPYTLQAERAALRLFFDDRALAESVAIPKRARDKITRSRGTKQHDRYFQPANWPGLVSFAQATGLRRHELRALRVGDVLQDHGAHMWVHVGNGKGGLSRDVPVLAGREAAVLTLAAGRNPDSLVFERIPKHMDVHSYRRGYAQALYQQYAPGRGLPPAAGRLRRSDYDRDAAERVTWALGHRRVDVVLRHYLR
ncbi:MAG: tyrosine-type recombinase/integrase [Ktedonobacteraceae bacterium]|nr:tyrosine-type recombinase/integrase [Ktedonobacteraceae bacterium]